MLTEKQHELLKYIYQRVTENGISPSYDEMKLAVNLHSKSGIHRLVNALEERGYIRRLPNRARALEILKHPFANQNNELAKKIEIEKTQSFKDENRKSSFVDIPIMGRIAAGSPITAIQEKIDNLHLPKDMLGKNHEHYALKIRGDSMIDSGIFDGDTVVVKRCETANNGDIIVALIDNEEATLKRFRKKGQSIALEPSNQNYETKIYSSDRVKIQGCLVSLIRNYH
ncbi:MAG: repressor LexA [Rhodobiaceae bacterium]|nr:repressor LexA [Rhodobiaceae bacterium]|tara:strand:- start:5565 stop:6245 length:681 start_codon:yes stop_codon:yes gene_type:complete